MTTPRRSDSEPPTTRADHAVEATDPVGPAAPGAPALPEGYRLRESAPTVEEYCRLRTDSGLSPKTPAQARGAIENSWAWVTVTAPDGAVVAMGRAMGDGAWYFHIADMATDPAHQRRGLGRAVMGRLLEMIDAAAEPDPYVTLMADPPGRPLYRSFGFVDSEPSLGMRRA